MNNKLCWKGLLTRVCRAELLLSELGALTAPARASRQSCRERTEIHSFGVSGDTALGLGVQLGADITHLLFPFSVEADELSIQLLEVS